MFPGEVAPSVARDLSVQRQTTRATGRVVQ